MPLVIIAIIVMVVGQLLHNYVTDNQGVQTYVIVSEKETGKVVYEEHSRTGYSFYKGVTRYVCHDNGRLLKSTGGDFIYLEQYSCDIKQKGTEF